MLGKYFVQPRAARLARRAAAQCANWVELAGEVSETVQVVLDCFVADYPRRVACEPVARGVEGVQAGDRIKAIRQ